MMGVVARLAGGDGEASSLVGGDLAGRVVWWTLAYTSYMFADLALVGRDVELWWSRTPLELY
jgi:hypothetical protein